jgi:hypothetical protein
MVGNLTKGFEATLDCIEPETGLMEPYLDQLTEKVKEARAANPTKTVAVAFALYLKSSRDYIRKITPEPVTFVQIQVTEDEVIARNMPRVDDFCKAAGKTPEDAWVMWGCDK